VAQPVSTLRQFYFNPYISNPAFTGSDGRTEVTLVHRQQWINIEDAPTVSGVFFQYATSTRSSFGFNLASQETVALRNTTVNGSFAYRLSIGQTHEIHFGMSAGVGFDDLHLEGDYSNDPTILNAAASNAYLDGSFGLLYVLGKLEVGFALPTLFNRPYFSPSTLGESSFTQLKNQFYSLSYSFDLGDGTWSIEPCFLYRMNRDQQNTWEGNVLIYYEEKIWFGTSYNVSLGMGFFAGILIKDRFRLGYGYELPPFEGELTNTSSHEVRIGVRLGNKKLTKAEEL
jgi:type IX secretion system PorP/SprF family membrane protein